MSVATMDRPKTIAELLAMPEDGVERELIRGHLRERPMTKRNRWHSRTEARIAYLIEQWLAMQPPPRGAVYAGEVGGILRHDPDTVFGIDVVYAAAELAAHDPKDTTLLDGVPILAVEILSPTDKQEEIDEKVDEYLAAGVALVWVVNPRYRTVTVYRPDTEPEMFNIRQEH
jgi:Uma2 family endonuclease